MNKQEAIMQYMQFVNIGAAGNSMKEVIHKLLWEENMLDCDPKLMVTTTAASGGKSPIGLINLPDPCSKPETEELHTVAFERYLDI